MDLNSLTVPEGDREVFGPVNAWPGAGSHVYVATHRLAPALNIQTGYDAESGRAWARTLSGANWNGWVQVAPPPEIEPPAERK